MVRPHVRESPIDTRQVGTEYDANDQEVNQDTVHTRGRQNLPRGIARYFGPMWRRDNVNAVEEPFSGVFQTLPICFRTLWPDRTSLRPYIHPK